MRNERDVRYQRVDFDSDNDDNDLGGRTRRTLAKDLGVSNRRRGSCERLIRSLFVLAVLCATAAGFVALFVYRTDIYEVVSNADSIASKIVGGNEVQMDNSTEIMMTNASLSSNHSSTTLDEDHDGEGDGDELSFVDDDDEDTTVEYPDFDDDDDASNGTVRRKRSMDDDDITENTGPETDDLSNEDKKASKLELVTESLNDTSTLYSENNTTANSNSTKVDNSTTSDTNLSLWPTTQLTHFDTDQLWTRLDEMDLLAICVLGTISALSVLLVLFCLGRLVQVRRRSRRQHFRRLVNDLNASEKYTIITPSDDELSD